ncbi:MAG: Calx-beta domain-containing protein [Gammaproteobacteria bacterium]|nr:Calx-beta domain-containing protein [Gammaproteobacteria bacterium]MDP2139754.1 Calx-beta domain-containing protein [Gammaproteobacteria bacterium]MDP2348956.1 Calx-beta domain-containing protein [Gammaproteobacteria bacterium]
MISLRGVCVFILLGCSLSARAGVIEFTATTFSGPENVTPMTVVTVSRTGVVTAAATVLVTSANGTAMAGADYTAVNTTLRWSAGDGTSKTVNIPITDDRLVEADETLTLTLSAVTGDTLGDNISATVTITDYEQGALQFSASQYQVRENHGAALITISRINGSQGEVTVNYATSNKTATAPEYYIAKSGTITFAEGVTSWTFPITIINNSVGQTDKSFGVTLSTLTGGAVAGEHMTTTVTIINDDTDFTPSLTRIAPVRAGVTQPAVLNLSQPSPFNTTTTLLQSINRIPELAITLLSAIQSTTGVMTIAVGGTTFHMLPLRATQVPTSTTPAIYLNPDFSGRMVTDTSLQIEFQPALAAIDVLQTQLTAFQLPRLTITTQGNITVQRLQGPPPLDLGDDGKLVINNSFYDRFNMRPSIVTTPAAAGSKVGVHFHPHPHPGLPNEVYLRVVYSNASQLREQLLTSAPVIAEELKEELLEMSGVSDVRFGEFGMVTFVHGGRLQQLYADLIIRRVDPASYTGALRTGLFNMPDLNGDGAEDFRMVYSTGDEQNFLYAAPTP